MSEFICPVCKTELIKSEKSYVCSGRHNFDISKDGYVNLLMSQQSSLKRHGDDKVMVRARRDFLSQGHYDTLRDAICDTVKTYSQDNGVIVDVGCGEGYYSQAVSQNFNCIFCGVDISKDALK